MIKRLLLGIILAGTSATVKSTCIDIDSILAYGLPVVVINTINGEEPTSEVVYAPDGCFGESLTNATKVPGRIVVMSASRDTVFDSGEYVKKQSGMTIKHRGNTSATMNIKKPFKIKLQKKGDMLGRGSEYADKDWLLLNPQWYFCNTVCLRMLQMLGQPWVPSMRYVNVVVNGEFRGLYMLSESVERSKCRVNISKSGYIIENDPYWWNEDRCFGAVIDTTHYKYTFKYPDTDDLTASQYDYIKAATEDMENSIIAGIYESKIDVASFAAWILFHDIIDDRDAGGANRYLTKDDATDASLFTLGPAWDFDAAFAGNIDDWSPIHNDYCFRYLFQSGNKAFVKAYVDKWNAVKDTLFDKIHEYITDFKESSEAEAVYKSFLKTEQMWYDDSTTTISEIKGNLEYVDSWLQSRQGSLNSLIATIDTTSTTAIRPIPADIATDNGGRTFNIMGHEVPHDTKGIVIRRGKKYLNR